MRRFVIATAVLMVLVTTQRILPQEVGGPRKQTERASAAPTTARNIATFHRYWKEIVNRGDFSKHDEIISPDFTLYHCGVPDKLKGIELFKQMARDNDKAYSRIEIIEDDLVASGNRIGTQWHGVAIQDRGPIEGFEVIPDDKEVTWHGMAFYTFDEKGLITEARLVTDFYDVFRARAERAAKRRAVQPPNKATGERYGENSEVGRFVQVNGIRLYYETYGSGPPLLLIHGNGGSIEAMRHQIEYFSKEYHVVVADSRGHGKSGLGAEPLTYVQMAEDLNLLLERLNLQSVYVLGWSDGGILGLLLAMKHPEKARKLAIMGANLRADGSYQWLSYEEIQRLQARIDSKISQGDQSKPWRRIKQHTLLVVEQPNIPAFQLEAVRAPTLVMAGDKDVIRDDHTLEIFHALPNAHLCIFPGATHMIPWEDPSAFNQTVESFFKTPFHRPDTKEVILDGFKAILADPNER